MNLPKGLREALGVQQGEALIFHVRPDGSAEVTRAGVLARRGRGLFAHLKRLDSETDDFIAERRAEAER